MTVNIKKLKSLSKKYGVTFREVSNGHIQIKGALLVNYYPLSKKKTAYVAQTNKGLTGITYNEAFKLSVTRPEKPDKVEKRKYSYKASKLKILKNKPWCHWCGTGLTHLTATLDHVVPLSIGGLNNMNNYVIACLDCNRKRADKMPEVSFK